MSNIKEFMDEIEAVCRKHGFSISHEDSGGGFLLAKFNRALVKWLRCAGPDNNEWSKEEIRNLWPDSHYERHAEMYSKKESA